MKVPSILIDLGTLMPRGSTVDAGGLRWTMEGVGFLRSRTQGGAAVQVFFDVGVAEDVAVGVVIDDVLIGGFDSTNEAQDARLRATLESTLPGLARHAADLRRAARSANKTESEQARARQKSALDHL